MTPMIDFECVKNAFSVWLLFFFLLINLLQWSHYFVCIISWGTIIGMEQRFLVFKLISFVILNYSFFQIISYWLSGITEEVSMKSWQWIFVFILNFIMTNYQKTCKRGKMNQNFRTNWSLLKQLLVIITVRIVNSFKNQ